MVVNNHTEVPNYSNIILDIQPTLRSDVQIVKGNMDKPTAVRDEYSMPMSEQPSLGISNEFKSDGYIHLKSCLDSQKVESLGKQFEYEHITSFATDNGLTRDDYLSVINKWSHWNKAVADIMVELSNSLRHQVAEVLESPAALPVGAILFRKSSSASEAGNKPTHSHQDISYARFPGSQMFRATTWIPLLLKNADTMAFAKGSHKMGIGKVEDFLSVDGDIHYSSNSMKIPSCDDVVTTALGDCILFDARTWHCSTNFPATTTTATTLYPSHLHHLRLAIGIQWLTPGGLDGLKPGAYFRWPSQHVPEFIDVRAMQREGKFGMDTSGYFLKCSLICLENEFQSLLGNNESYMKHLLGGACSKRFLIFSDYPKDYFQSYSTIKLAEKFSDPSNSLVVTAMQNLGCASIAEAQKALFLYVLMRKAASLHAGEAQGTKVFNGLWTNLIQTILFKSTV
mmetsp:Transcript_23615/g.33851  ORF Transcript_23615/g.33851 Transcript_23615/m.33851 type:complete len:454 (-) Transcript_23615:49-1410(-)